MYANFPATVPLIEEAHASERVKLVFQDIKATKGIDFIPAFWRVLANQPDLLESTWLQLKRVMHPEAMGRTSQLDARTREIIAVAVSATNGCAYCVNSHSAALKKLGVDIATLSEIMSIVALFNSTNALAEGFQIEPDVRPNF
jgi:AhpD family alkylhydroperoxidase